MADEKELKQGKETQGILKGVLGALQEQNKASQEEARKLQDAMRDLVDNSITDVNATFKEIQGSKSQLAALKDIASQLVILESIMSVNRLDTKMFEDQHLERQDAMIAQLQQMVSNGEMVPERLDSLVGQMQNILQRESTADLMDIDLSTDAMSDYLEEMVKTQHEDYLQQIKNGSTLDEIRHILAMDRLDAKRHSASGGSVENRASNMISGGGASGSGKKDKGLADNALIKKLGLAAGAKSLAQAAQGIAMMGVAIPAFFGGLMIGNAALGLADAMGADMNFGAIKKAAKGFASIITEMDDKTMLAVVGLIGVAGLAGTKSPYGAAASVGLMGAAISAFLGGLVIGNEVLGLAEAAGADMNFGAMKKAMEGFGTMINALDPKALVALGGVIVAAGYGGVKGSKPLDVAKSIAATGAGIVGFLGGFVLGELALAGLGAVAGEYMNLDLPGLTSLMGGFNGLVSALDPPALLALGGVVAIGAGLAKLGGSPMKMVTSMTSIGLGIMGLLGGFIIGETLLDLGSGFIGSLNFDNLTAAVTGFNNVVEALGVNGLAAMGTIIGIGALITKFFSVGDIATFALTMTAIGAGIGGFFGGFALGAYALDKLGSIDYSGIQEGIFQFGLAVDSLSDRGLAAFGALLGAGSILTAVLGFGTALLPVAMGAIGAGIGAFIGGFDGVGALISKTGLDGSGIAYLMGMVARGLEEFENIDGANLQALSVGLLAIGPGFASLLGAQGLGVLAEGGKKLVDGIKGFFGMKSEDNGGLIGQIMGILGDPNQIEEESLDKLDKLITAIASKDTSGFKDGVQNIADGMALLMNDDRGFFTKLGDKVTGANNPFKFLFELADRNREITYVGNGVKNLANGMEKISTLGEYKMPDGFDAFMFDVNKQTSVLNSGARAIDKYVQSMDALYASGNVSGLVREAELSTTEMKNSQTILDDSRQKQTNASNTIIAPSSTSVVNSNSTTNQFSLSAPPAQDRHDEMYIFRSSGSPR